MNKFRKSYFKHVNLKATQADTQAVQASKEGQVDIQGAQVDTQEAQVDIQANKDITLNNIISNQVSVLQDPTLMPPLNRRISSKVVWEAYQEGPHRPLQIRKARVSIRV